MATSCAQGCCRLVLDTFAASGTVFQFVTSEGESQGSKDSATPADIYRLLPGVKEKVKNLESSWGILTCHSIIPGHRTLADEAGSATGWSIWIENAEYDLKDIVCGCVSCCGTDCVIGPGGHVLTETHQNVDDNRCTLDLNFTFLFLKKYFVDRMSEVYNPPLIKIPQHSTNSQQPDDENFKFKIYCAQENQPDIRPFDIEIHVSGHETGREASAVCEHPQEGYVSLQKEIQAFKGSQKMLYKCDGLSKHVTTMKERGLSGAPIFCTCTTASLATEELIGFHIGESSRTQASTIFCGNTVYGIIRLLQGGPVPVLAVLEKNDAHKLWPNRWDELLMPQESQLELPRLLEMITVLRNKLNSDTDSLAPLRLVQVRYQDPPECQKAALHLLIRLFRNVAHFSEDELKDVLTKQCRSISDQLVLNIRELLEDIVVFMEHSSNPPTSQIKSGTIQACFQCLHQIMEFKGIDADKELQRLQDTKKLKLLIKLGSYLASNQQKQIDEFQKKCAKLEQKKKEEIVQLKIELNNAL